MATLEYVDMFNEYFLKENKNEFELNFIFNGKKFSEKFTRNNLNNNNLWNCSCNSYLFTHKIYDICKPSELEIIELNNIKCLLNNEQVNIFNFTNNITDNFEFVKYTAKLI